MSSQSNPSTRPVAIVTGGLQGLGLGIASQLLEDGFNIAIIDLLEGPAWPKALSSGLKEGQACKYYRLDISDIERHEFVLDAIMSDFGRLDCLVNNAGIAARPLSDILNLSPEAFDRSIDINLRGTFFLIQSFANLLIASGKNEAETYHSIIIITSIAAQMISTDRSQYCISKSALSMVTKLFAVRLASVGIHVHEIRPGFMKTKMTESVSSETIEGLLNDGYVPIRRWGQSEDVGQAVSTLAQGLMPYMTGQAFWVAGGLNVATRI